jgi:hypothetical protein
MGDDIPDSVRVRTDEGNRHRWRSIQSASDFYGCNRSDAVAYACHDVPALVESVVSVLERDDLTGHQRQEIAATFDDAVQAININLTEPEVSVGVDR